MQCRYGYYLISAKICKSKIWNVEESPSDFFVCLFVLVKLIGQDFLIQMLQMSNFATISIFIFPILRNILL